jgi:hypothetical protein
LDDDDRLGAGEAARQMGVILFQQCELCRQRIGFEGFRATPGRCQRAEGAGFALAAPVAEGGRVNPFATQNGANAAGFEGAIGCRMRSLSAAVNVRRLGRFDNSGETVAGAATTVGPRPPSVATPAAVWLCKGSMGINQGILPRLRV